VDCNNCFLSYNLLSKKFCIKNVQYTKEEYFEELAKFNLKSRASREKLTQEFEEIKKKILDFLGENKLTVISTVDSQNNKPEAAVVAFAEKENLELIFGTSNTSRKYKNIQIEKTPHFITSFYVYHWVICSNSKPQ
jgi:hypothetical protein